MGNPVEVLRGVHEMLGAADVVKVSSDRKTSNGCFQT